MKAITQDRYGPAGVLRFSDVEMPVPANGEVLVRVVAASAHPGDWHLMTGLPRLVRVMGYGLRAPAIPVRGTDLAGIVEAVGSGVADLRPGDAVFGIGTGAFAEYALARARDLVAKPTGLTFEQAAALPTSGVTALQAVGEVGGGDRVMVVGAGGGVGTFAVQLAVAAGAHVTGVCGAGKLDLVRSLGARQVVDYTRDGLGGERHDLIVDTAGSRPIRRLRRSLTPRGRLVIVGGEGGGDWIGMVGRALRATAISPFVPQTLSMLFSTVGNDDLVAVARLADERVLVPVVGRTYPLIDTADALRHLGEGHAYGKVVVVP